MMRAPHSYCVAVRKPSGELVTDEHPVHRMSEKYPIFRLPVLRGLGTLGQAMALGMKALKFSTNQMLDDGSEKSGQEKHCDLRKHPAAKRKIGRQEESAVLGGRAPSFIRVSRVESGAFVVPAQAQLVALY